MVGAITCCSFSTAGSVEIVRWAKSKGWNVTAEACPHHLLLTDELAATYDPIYKVNPPLRREEAMRAVHVDGTRRLVEAAAGRVPTHWSQLKDCPTLIVQSVEFPDGVAVAV